MWYKKKFAEGGAANINLKKYFCCLANDRIISIFVSLGKYGALKSYKVAEVLSMLKKDGWILYSQKGSHRQFKHPTKKGKVTVNGKPSDHLSQFLLHSIFKQAGWK